MEGKYNECGSVEYENGKRENYSNLVPEKNPNNFESFDVEFISLKHK